jgi:hypothetical protein
MPNYNLKSGETRATMKQPSSVRYHMCDFQPRIRQWVPPEIDWDEKARMTTSNSNWCSSWGLSCRWLWFIFQSFKIDSIIAHPVGGTAAEPVELGNDNFAANPAWDLICSNCKDQRRVDGQLARHIRHKFLSLKRKTELEEQLARTKAKKEKQKNIKAIQ